MGESSRFPRIVSGAILAGALLYAAAAAAMPAPAPSIKTGGLTSQPIGHYEFCQRAPEECSIRPVDRGALVVTPAIWRMVDDVNREVNGAVKPVSDLDLYGREEWWAYPTRGVGDCEDYVLEKRRRLAEAGIPLSDLLITVLRKADGEGHAVLTLRTDRGDFILDNLKPDIRAWTETNYRFLKRQASNHTGRWVTLHEDRNLLVGALR